MKPKDSASFSSKFRGYSCPLPVSTEYLHSRPLSNHLFFQEFYLPQKRIVLANEYAASDSIGPAGLYERRECWTGTVPFFCALGFRYHPIRWRHSNESLASKNLLQ